jgi:hypothetical protein
LPGGKVDNLKQVSPDAKSLVFIRNNKLYLYNKDQGDEILLEY